MIHDIFLEIFNFIKFIFDQKWSIFIPNVVRDENTSFLIENKLDKNKNHKKSIMTRKIPILITYIILFNWKPAKCKRKNSQFFRKSINTGGSKKSVSITFSSDPRQLKLQLAPLALAGMSLRNVQQISSDVENHLKM